MKELSAIPIPIDEAGFEKSFTHYLGELKRLQRQMDRDHKEIEQMQVETRDILADIMVTIQALRA